MTRSRNSIIALACGDAYGNEYEMKGLTGTTFSKDNLPSYALKKQFTDDTKMALILWEHYTEHGCINEKNLFRSYQDWALQDGQKDGIGIHTARVLLYAKTDKNSQGNGVLMRVLPFGLRLIDEGMSLDEAMELVRQDAQLTHDNEIVHLSNKICLDIACNGIDVLEKSEYQSLLSNLQKGHTAWLIHTLYDVIDVLNMDIGLLDGFKELVSRGGDTDTNCAIYGSIRGYREDIDLNIDDFLDENSQQMLKYVIS